MLEVEEVIFMMINAILLDQKDNVAYYHVKFIKERKVKKKYADC